MGAEFLVGNLKILRNQFNETSKNFASFLELPDMNHFALEGLARPVSNKDNLTFFFIDSSLYHPRIIKRSTLTKQIVQKNKIKSFLLIVVIFAFFIAVGFLISMAVVPGYFFVIMIFAIIFLIILIFVFVYSYIQPKKIVSDNDEIRKVATTTSIKALFVGDMMLDRNVRNIIARKGFDYFFLIKRPDKGAA